MNIRKLTSEDSEKALDLYARCMADLDYFKTLYRLRRDADHDERVLRVAAGQAAVIARSIAYSASFGAFEGDRLSGACIGFWYKVVREHDRGLHDALFHGMPEACAEMAGLRGAVYYDLALCVDPDRRGNRIASRLLDSMRMHLRPDWIAAAPLGDGADGIFKRIGCSCRYMDDGIRLQVGRLG